MKKRIVQSLALLGVNLVVGFLAGLGFVLFITKGDPILAAVPVVLALPGILLQPWFVVFFLLPAGLLLAPFLTTAVTVLVCVLLDRKGRLGWAKQMLARLKTRKTYVIAGVAIICVLGIGFARYVDFPAMNRGLPRTLQYAAQDMDLNLGNPRYYCLGSFIDSEWLWQAGIREEDLDRLAEKLSMHPAPLEAIGDQYQAMPPYWWQPVISAQVRVLATTNFPADGRGPDGWHALATWNPEDEVLHMWIKDNF